MDTPPFVPPPNVPRLAYEALAPFVLAVASGWYGVSAPHAIGPNDYGECPRAEPPPLVARAIVLHAVRLYQETLVAAHELAQEGFPADAEYTGKGDAAPAKGGQETAPAASAPTEPAPVGQPPSP